MLVTWSLSEFLIEKILDVVPTPKNVPCTPVTTTGKTALLREKERVVELQRRILPVVQA